MAFYDTLVEQTQPQRELLYTIPQLAAGLKGEISRAAYVAYLTEAYHHVKHTVPFLMAMGARLSEKDAWLRRILAEYIQEEIGHEEWILNDIATAGGKKECVRQSKPSFATELLVAYNYDYIARKNPVGFFGMVFMLESTSVAMATAGAGALQTSLGLPKEAFSYLYSHGALDIGHLDFFKNTVNRIDDPAHQLAIIEVAQTTFHLFAEMLRSIPFTPTQGISHAA